MAPPTLPEEGSTGFGDAPTIIPTTIEMMRRALLFLILAAAAPGCSGALEGVGDLSGRFVHGDETTSTATEDTGPALGLKGVTDLIWMNDDLDARDVGSRDALIRAVWERGDKISPFVQASRVEIAAALPGIEFPKLTPQVSRYVTSQLVFDPQTAQLDAASSAAFGLWSVEPYTVPRSESQQSVLRVGLAGSDEAETAPGDIAQFNVEGGRELTWVKEGYVYQLFCRTGIVEEACFAIAESTSPLALLALVPTGGGLGG
jgi:hypothetical protein